MSKVLQTAALVVGAVALAATGIGALGDGVIFASAGGIAAGGIATATIATFAGLSGVALEVGASLLAPHPGSGSATTFKADPYAGVPYVMGRTFNAGNIIYRRTYNTPGYGLPDLQSFGVILSGAGPIQGIESFQSDKPTQVYDNNNNLIASTDTRVYFDGNGNATTGSFPSWMWQTQQLGACPETRALAKTWSGPYPPDWDANSKLSGMAAAMWTIRYDQKGKMFTSGVPAPGWVLLGVLCYDPRLDSTYPGGSGACRALNEATYVYSENPYLHALTFALGRWQNGVKVFGIGAPMRGIDVAAFVEGANVAAANGWKVGGVIYSTDDKWNNLKQILQAGGGEPMFLGAQLSCYVNTPRVVLDTVTTADVVGEVSLAATQPRRTRINSIIPSYRSELHLWEIIPTVAPVQVPAYLTIDGGLRQKEVTYSLVQDVNQASQLARYDVENSREFGPGTLPLKLRWMGYKPGDCIAVTLPESGLAAQPVVIRTRNLNPGSGAVTLTVRSETNAKHAFALGQTGTAPPTPHVTGPPLVPVPADGAWTIAATGLTAAGSTIPALVVAGAAANLAIDGIVFEYRVWTSGMDDAAGWIAAGSEPASATGKQITALLAGTLYEVGVSYQLGSQIGPRSVLGPVTTAGVSIDFAAGVGGATKPGDNATQNLAGDFANRNGSFEMPANADGTLPGWTLAVNHAPGAVVRYPYPSLAQRGVCTALLTGACFLIGEGFAVSAGERLWFRAGFVVNHGAAGTTAAGDLVQIALRLRFFDGTGTELYPAGQDILDGNYPWGAGTLSATTSIVAPAGATTAKLTIFQDYSPTGPTLSSVFYDYFECSRTQFGADVTGQNTAIDTANIAGQNAVAFAAAAATAALQAAAATSALSIIGSDGYLSRGEKPAAIIDWNDLEGTKAALDAEATALGITTEATAWDNAHDALGAYLSSLSPAWNDTSRDTPIVAATWASKWQIAYNARLALLNRMSGVAATLATWGGVSGPGRPADNADVTAAVLTAKGIADGATRNVPRGNWTFPTAYAVGDIVLYGSPASSYTCVAAHTSDGSHQPPGNANWQVSAQGVAGANALAIVAAPNPITIACDAIGNPKAGQLPVTITAKVTRNTADITSTTTFAVAPPGVTQYCSATDHGGGSFTLDGVTADNAYIEIDIAESGQASLVGIAVTKVRDGAPSASQSLAVSPSAASGYTVGSGATKVLPVGPNGTIRASINLNYSPSPTGAGGTDTQAVEVFYRTTPGSGTWVSFGAEVVGSASSQGGTSSEPADPVYGSASLNQSMTGPASAANWEFWFGVRMAGGNRGGQGTGNAAVSFTP